MSNLYLSMVEHNTFEEGQTQAELHVQLYATHTFYTYFAGVYCHESRTVDLMSNKYLACEANVGFLYMCPVH